MEESTRLVDYFVIAGYNHKRANGSSGANSGNSGGGFTCQGTVLQRFPEKDWSDSPFIGKNYPGPKKYNYSWGCSYITSAPCVLNIMHISFVFFGLSVSC